MKDEGREDERPCASPKESLDESEGLTAGPGTGRGPIKAEGKVEAEPTEAASIDSERVVGAVVDLFDGD